MNFFFIRESKVKRGCPALLRQPLFNIMTSSPSPLLLRGEGDGG
jgi:hypothetical protein